MPTLRQKAIASRETLYVGRIRGLVTAARRFWTACGWLLLEVRRLHARRDAEAATQSVDEATRVVLGLVALVRERLPLPEELYKAGAGIAARAGLPPRERPGAALGDIQHGTGQPPGDRDQRGRAA